jgi:hypothetical protein
LAVVPLIAFNFAASKSGGGLSRLAVIPLAAFNSAASECGGLEAQVFPSKKNITLIFYDYQQKCA